MSLPQSPRSQGEGSHGTSSASVGDESYLSEKQAVDTSTLEPMRDRHGSIQPVDRADRSARRISVDEFSTHKRRLPLGLSALAFGLCIAGITAVVVGAIVGGSVAGAMKHSSSSSPAATITTTVTVNSPPMTATATTTSIMTAAYDGLSLPSPSSLYNYSVPEAYYVGSLNSPCPWTLSNPYETANGDQYVIDCNIDMNTGLPDEKYPTRKAVDIVSIFAYSFEDCLQACDHANNFAYNSKGAFPRCEGVSFGWAMAAYNTSAGANCWLKNGTSAGIACDSCMSAKLK